MFDFLFEGRLADITAFNGITENSTDEEKYEFCGYCLNTIAHGIGSGCLMSFIYYKDTSDFFDQHKQNILDYFDEWHDESLFECLTKKLDISDIISCNEYAKNFYVWVYVENTLFAHEWDFEEALKEYNSRESYE